VTTPRLPLPDAALDQLFRQAHTAHAFLDAPMEDSLLHTLYDLTKWAPTAFNAQPARWVFVRSPEAKALLLPALMPGNVPQVKSASVTVIVAHDSQFQEHLPSQFPAYNAKPLFDNDPVLTETTAFRNSSLQGAYLILAARSLGLDVGVMSGFDAQQINAAFFPDGRWRVNFLMNLGVADPTGIHPRGPRLPFEAVASIR
jgi:3-hydroxypropanoate dehydrogenase